MCAIGYGFDGSKAPPSFESFAIQHPVSYADAEVEASVFVELVFGWLGFNVSPQASSLFGCLFRAETATSSMKISPDSPTAMSSSLYFSALFLF